MADKAAETKRVLQKFGDEEIEVIYRKADPPEKLRSIFPPLEPKATVEDGILIERDVSMQLRDKTRIYADIFRPEGAKDVPAIISWSFAGKNYTFQTRSGGSMSLVPDGAVSGWAKQEGPDPAYWCHYGYAVINVDPRGVGNSEGDIHFLGSAEAEDCYDFIEWLAEQYWCSGRIAMYGTAWQGNSAWVAAAAKPPHLTCIAPWEAFYNFHSAAVARGGIVDAGILEHIMSRLHGCGYAEDVVAMAREYPCMNGYWDDKIAKVENIDIPAYVVSNCNMFHSEAMDAYRRMPSVHKWLRTHDNISWRDIYYPDNIRELHCFFDRYLKNIHNGWEFTPQVRLSVYDSQKNIVNRPEDAWPPSRTEYRVLYLNAADNSLLESPVKEEASIRYNSENGKKAIFTYRFREDTELTGYAKLRLWVEAESADDMDLFVSLERLDAEGNMLELPYFKKPHGSNSGIQRVSHRGLDPERSTPAEPYLTHQNYQPLKKEEIVRVDIPLWPLSYVWHTGEQLRVVIKGTPDLTGLAVKAISKLTWELVNKGSHIIYTGGKYDTQLLVPVLPQR